jgi:uracil-DNA glycosylase
VKPIIIGQAPARGNEGKPPFAGRSGARLAQLSGVGSSGDILPQHFELYNLIEYYPGKKGKGDEFDLAEGMAAAKLLKTELFKRYSRTPILLMGRKVRRCMGVNGNWDYLSWFDFGPHIACVFPHPSGVNRWWNDPKNTEAARLEIRGALEYVPPKG